MVKESALLLREADKVNSYISNYVTLADPANRDELLALFDQMYRFFPHWVISTCPMMHPEIHYISQNCPHVFGCTAEYLIDNSPLEKYIHFIHEDDRQDLYKCYSFMHDYFASIPRRSYQLSHSISLSFQKSETEYIYLQDEKAALNLRAPAICTMPCLRISVKRRLFAA
jgi:hypothetical protein